MKRVSAVEEAPLDADPGDAVAIYERLVRLRAELAPRLDFVSGPPKAPVIHNLVGSVQVSAKLVVDIAPKTMPNTDWQTAVIDLLATDRVHAGGSTQQAALAQRPLPDAFAYLYAAQLGRALRTAGPLLVMRHEESRKPPLTGRLDVTAWVRSRQFAPHIFPQHSTVLTADNEFTRAMSWVALALAARVTDAATRSRLLRLARDVRPGLPEHPLLDPGVAQKPLPPQWREYTAAWATATAILRRISPLHREGTQEGLNLAVEPWPLLETLLGRSLRLAARLGLEAGHDAVAAPKYSVPYLKAVPGGEMRHVVPDGVLLIGGAPVASFEAKYSSPTTERLRVHGFQAMTTASALGARLAVLVYPQNFQPRVWLNVGATTPPIVVAAVGVDMYAYRWGTGEQVQGARLWDLVHHHALGHVGAAPIP
jgi:hypothetical protein